MVFVDCNFGKTVLEYARIVGSKFIKGSEAVKYFERLFIEAIGICFAAIMVFPKFRYIYDDSIPRSVRKIHFY